MSKRSTTLLVGAVAVALAASGCGGSEDSANAPPLSKADFAKKAEAICTKAFEQLKVEYRDFGAGQGFSSLESLQEYADTILIPSKERELEELRALGAPKGDEGQVEGIFEGIEEGIELTAENPAKALGSTASVFEQAATRAQRYGLASCLSIENN